MADNQFDYIIIGAGSSGCVVAGDAVKRRVEEQMEIWDVTPQWVVSSVEEAGLVNGYDHPTRLGSDRWVAMIGARHRMLAREAARPMVVVMVVPPWRLSRRQYGTAPDRA